VARVLLAAAFSIILGCSLDISRVRNNVPLDREAYGRLEQGRTTLSEVLATLGAPHQLEHKSDLDYFWYLHQDSTNAGIRFQSPISFFGYRQTFARLQVDAVDTSSMRLVFGPDGRLQHKSLRLAPGFTEPGAERPGWAFYLLPRYGFSPYLFGDGGEESYGDLFSHGQVFGGYLGALPAPYFMLLLGVNYQDFEGDAFSLGPSRVKMEDLHFYQIEIGGRLHVKPEIFTSFFDVEKLRALLYSDDIAQHRGTFLTFQWTVGGVFNEEVGAAIDGIPSGSYFENAVGFSTTVGLGAEYRWTRLGIHGGIDYQNVNGFESGDAPLDTSGGNFNNFTFNIGASLKF